MNERLIIDLPAKLQEEVSANNWLANYARSVTSQDGEDGIIEKIFDVLGKQTQGWCVEFGALDGKTHSNTWNLLNNKGWSGVLIEAKEDRYLKLKKNYHDRSDVYCLQRYVNWEGPDSLDNIFAETPLPRDFDLLVIDIDGNDAHVFSPMQNYHPHVLCIEFHRLIHPSVRYLPPKDFSLNWSASLGSIYDIAKEKGYELVCVHNWNAFFVKREHFAKFNIADNRPEKMFIPTEEMRIFQGYDGTLRFCGYNKFYWKLHLRSDGVRQNIHINERDIQVLPDHLRVFRPRHTYRCKTLAQQAGKLDMNRVPGNVLLAKRNNITSECGEDGILEYIFNKLEINDGYLVDVGACDGEWFSQSYNLLHNKGWRGLAIEKDADAYRKLAALYHNNSRVDCLYQEVGIHEMNSLDNILLNKKVPRIDFLTIDIEGNDFFIWTTLKNYAPAVVAIDFNPSISNDIFYIQAFNSGSPSGASLKALMLLAENKSYELAAVTDWNAIFVRKDLFPLLNITNNTIDAMYYPPFEMRMMQTMDSCLHLLTCSRLIRQDFDILFEDFQVLPKSMRETIKVFGIPPAVFYEDDLEVVSI